MNKISNASRHILSSSRNFALYVNDDRAIPLVSDGLKHVQRVALWEMRTKADKLKVTGLVGALMGSGSYHHGDAAAGDAISLLAAPYRNNVPLLTGEGQFGSRVAPVEGIGSPRYVYVRRSKAAEAFLYTDYQIIPMEENFDGSDYQPVSFLPLIPVVLLNGVSGIGVGYSSEILPRSFADIVDASISALKGKTLKLIAPHYERYDLDCKPTGITNQWEISGKIDILDTSRIRVKELPYSLGLDKFRKRLIEMEENDQIVRYIDSSSDEINIEIVFKRGSLSGMTEAKIIDLLKLREKTTERIVVRDWTGRNIVQYSDAETLIGDFVKWRLSWYARRYQKLLDDTLYELTYWEILALLFQKGFTKKLGTFPNRATMKAEIEAIATKAKIAYQDEHIERILNIATYRWTKDFEAEILKKIADLKADIATYQGILADPKKQKAIYLSELEALKKLKF